MARACQKIESRGITPPADPAAEQSVIGAILLRPSVLDEVADLLGAGDFYQEKSRLVYQSMMDLRSQGYPVDLRTVAELLKDRGQLEEVGPLFLAGLSEHVGIAANAPYYARLVHNKAVLRKLAELGLQIHHEAGKGEANSEDLLLYLQSQGQDLASRNGSGRRLDLRPAICEANEFVDLDLPERKNYLHPFLRESSIGMITADRGVGKSMLALGICDSIARGDGFGPWEGGQPVNCLFIDGEMVAQDIIERLGYFPTNKRPARFYVLSDHCASLKGLPGANLLNPEWRVGIKEFCLANHIGFAVFDNLASLAPGIDENSSMEWGPLAKYFIELRFLGISGLLLHHTNKAGGQRGTHSREDVLDYSILLEHPKNYCPTEGTRFNLHFTKARVRQSDAHLISPVELKLEGDPAGSYTWIWKYVKTQNQRAILEMLDQGLKQQEIADAVGVTRSRVAQIKGKAVKDGWVTEKGKLTQKGISTIQELT